MNHEKIGLWIVILIIILFIALFIFGFVILPKYYPMLIEEAHVFDNSVI